MQVMRESLLQTNSADFTVLVGPEGSSSIIIMLHPLTLAEDFQAQLKGILDKCSTSPRIVIFPSPAIENQYEKAFAVLALALPSHHLLDETTIFLYMPKYMYRSRDPNLNNLPNTQNIYSNWERFLTSLCKYERDYIIGNSEDTNATNAVEEN